ncbi:MAG: hypothetical protein HRT73_08835, partial [Flavobacteriales bacterium]|nr:hypothetical protein [Flavobacteriales bacterium]
MIRIVKMTFDPTKVDEFLNNFNQVKDKIRSFDIDDNCWKIAEDLNIGNGNAAGPAVGKWSLDFIDSPATTNATTYTLKYTLNGSNF